MSARPAHGTPSGTLFPALFGLASGALAEARRLGEGLEVNAARMQANLDITRGLLFADTAAGIIAIKAGRAAAHHLVEQAAGAVRDGGMSLLRCVGCAAGPAGGDRPCGAAPPPSTSLPPSPPPPVDPEPQPSPRLLASERFSAILIYLPGAAMPLLSVNGASLFVDETGPRRRARRGVLELAGHDGGDVGRAGARARRAFPLHPLRHARPWPIPRDGANVGIDTLVDDLAGVIDAFGLDKPVVVGLSLGGITAQGLAIRHPGKVRALVLMATAPHLPPRQNWLDRAELVTAQGLGAIVDAIMQRWFTPGMARE